MAVSSQCAVCSKSDVQLLTCSRCKKTSYCSQSCQAEAWPTHKSDCKRPNYLLKFQIIPEEITDPPVWRTLSVPATTTFAKLHRALQIAFSWAGTHSYEFGVRDPNYDPNTAHDGDPTGGLMAHIKRMSVMDSGRALSAEEAGPREYLVRVIDDADYSRGAGNFGFGPVDSMHKRNWDHPRTLEKNASEVKLVDIIGKDKYKDHKFTYTYDYGDCWVHEFTSVGTAPATAKIRCTDGGGHYIAEDAGHVRGWEEVLEAYRASNPNKAQLDKRRWFEQQASNADPKGLANGGEQRWDKDGINMKLSVLA